jgi:hypothetical protein
MAEYTIPISHIYPEQHTVSKQPGSVWIVQPGSKLIYVGYYFCA